MKNIIIGFMSLVFFIMILLISATVYNKGAREAELENAVNNALSMAIKSLDLEDNYKPQSEDEWIALFQQVLLQQIDSASDIEIKVLNADYSKGLLSVEVSSVYKHLNGNPGKITVTKMAVRDTYVIEDVINQYKITYYTNGKIYREYTVNEGTNLPTPATMIANWVDLESNTTYTAEQIAAMTATKDMKFSLSE